MLCRPALPALLAILFLAGCGGSDPTSTGSAAGASTVQPRGGATLVAALGDSITAGAPLWDPDPTIRAQIGAFDERSQYEYWAARADPALEFSNCGVSGERTDQIALRLDGCAADADALVVQGGVNDIAQGRPVGAAAADLRAMVRRGKRLGLRVAIAELLPWNNGHPAADDEIERLNRLIGAIGRDEGVPVLRWHRALEDPAEPGTMRADLTIDGDHPSVAGYRILGGRTFQLPGG